MKAWGGAGRAEVVHGRCFRQPAGRGGAAPASLPPRAAHPMLSGKVPLMVLLDRSSVESCLSWNSLVGRSPVSALLEALKLVKYSRL